MALVIEDGTGKVDSDSYVTVAEARAYASRRGTALSADDAEVEVQLHNGMDYLESKRALYQGSKTYPENPQALQFPRTGVTVDGTELAVDAIPVELKKAQCQLCVEQQKGLSLLAGSDGRVVLREKVDVLEVQYASPADFSGGVGGMPSYPAVDALLEPLYGPSGGFGFSTVRV